MSAVAKLLPSNIPQCVMIILLVVAVYLLVSISRQLQQMNAKLDHLTGTRLSPQQPQPFGEQDTNTTFTQP